jgi:hypothetical protein
VNYISNNGRPVIHQHPGGSGRIWGTSRHPAMKSYTNGTEGLPESASPASTTASHRKQNLCKLVAQAHHGCHNQSSCTIWQHLSQQPSLNGIPTSHTQNAPVNCAICLRLPAPSDSAKACPRRLRSTSRSKPTTQGHQDTEADAR